MTDTPNNDTPQDSNAVSPSPSQAQNSEHMIPKSRFDEVNNQYKELKSQLEQLQSERQQRAEAELAEQNKWQELAEQRKAEIERLQGLETEVDRYRSGFNSTLEARLSQIPDDKKHLVPEYDDPIKLSAWLDKALPDLVEPSKPKAPSLDGGSGKGSSGGSQSALSAEVESVADLARSLGYAVNTDNVANLARNPRQLTDLGD